MPRPSLRPRPLPSRTLKLGLAALLLLATFAVHAWATRPQIEPTDVIQVPAPSPAPTARIEVAFVLDTTGSMSGLIEGAKRKIWSIASQMASSRQQTELRVALVGYRDRGDEYVTRRVGLTEDVDGIYARLREFRAQGGGDTPESVNQALHEAVTALSWTPGDDVYRVIFLVGDAPAHMDYQDDVPWTESLRLARQKDIVVNTMQCGDMEGTRTLWQQIAMRGSGQYAAIAQDGGMVAIATPMDEELADLNRELAGTVVAYGSSARKREVAEKLTNAAGAPAPTAASRLSYLEKTGRKVISGAGDLVEAVKDGLSLDAVAEQDLPTEMQALDADEREAWVQTKLEEREKLQARVDGLVASRDAYVAQETARRAAEGRAEGFDEKVFETIKKQAAAKGIEY